MFIKVERSNADLACVTLSGPSEALDSIYFAICNSAEMNVGGSRVGTAMEIRLTGGVQSADNSMLLKVILLEEVLKRGFIPASNVTDDLLVLSRELDM